MVRRTRLDLIAETVLNLLTFARAGISALITGVAGISTLTIFVPFFILWLIVVLEVVFNNAFRHTFARVGRVQGTVIATPQGAIDLRLALFAIPERVRQTLLLTYSWPSDIYRFFFLLPLLLLTIISDPIIDNSLRNTLASKVRMQALPPRTAFLAVLIRHTCTLIPVPH